MDSSKNVKGLNSLPSVDRAKVSNIVEVCNVTADEATRVLQSCHMDASLAIDRFLSGKEPSTWSEVSKKKKHPTSSRTGPGARHNRGGTRGNDREQDRDNDRRSRDRPAEGGGHRRHARASGSREYQQNGNHKSSEGSHSGNYSAPKRSSEHRNYSRTTTAEKDKPVAPASVSTAAPPSDMQLDPFAQTASDKNNQAGLGPAEIGWNDTQHDDNASSQRIVWGIGIKAKAEPIAQSSVSDTSEQKPVNGLKMSTSENIRGANVQSKRTINYAAAAATGTSHEKRPAEPTAQVSNATITSSTGAPPTVPLTDQTAQNPDHAVRADSSDSKKKRSRGNRKNRSRVEGQRNGQLSDATLSPPHTEVSKESSTTGSNTDVGIMKSPQKASASVPSETPDITSAPRSETVSSATVQTNAWVTRATAKDAKESGIVHVAPASSTLVSSAPEKKDSSLILQFGSFGFSSLNPAGWEKPATPQDESIPKINTPTGSVQAVPHVPVVPVPIESLKNSNSSVATASSNNTHPSHPGSAANADTLEPAVPKAHIPPAFSAPASLPSTSGSIANGSIFPPVMPVGVTGAFPPQSYAPPPYIMPPPLPYASGLNSYDNGSDLNSTRNPNLGPAVPLYDPTALGIPTPSNGAKYNNVPGLGDSSMLPGGAGVGSSKDMLHSGAIGDNDKSTNPGNAGIPGGIDALAPPYMMPGYPPYLVPGYASMQYAPPPGMGPSVPSHFPYPPVGQVTSQAGFGGYHGQSGNMNKFSNGGNAGRVPFGFDDGSSGISGSNARSTSGLNESVYAQGGYLNSQMPENMMAKNMGENAAYKNPRGAAAGGVGSALHGVGVTTGGGPLVSASAPVGGAGTVMPPYNEYTGSQVHNANPLNVGSVAPGGWNNRQPGTARSDGTIGNQGPSNNVLAGNAANSGIYPPAPGAPSGYWAGNGYY